MNKIAATLVGSFLFLGPSSLCQAAIQPAAVLQIGHAGAMTSAAWSPDGKFLVTGGEDDHVLIWRANKSELLARLEPSPDPRGVARNGGSGLGIHIDQILFSTDGSVLLGTRKLDGTPDTVAWNFRSRTELSHMPGWPIKILADNDSVLVLDDRQVFLWSIRERKRIRTFGEASILTDEAKLSTDNRYVLSYRGANWVISDKTARLWETSSGKLLQTWKPDAGIVGVDFDEGEHAALALSTSGVLAVIKTPSLKIHEVKLDTKGTPNSIHWAWPGVVAVEIQSKANYSTESVSFFDTTSGKMLRNVEGEWIGRNTDGSQVINQGKRWFVSELHQTVVVPPNHGALRTLGQQIYKPWIHSPDGRAFIANRYINQANGGYAASDGSSPVPQISSFKDGALLHQLPDGNLAPFQSMTSTSDGRLLVLSRGKKGHDSNMGDGNSLVVWDLEQGVLRKDLEGVKTSGRIQVLPGRLEILVESPSGNSSSVIDTKTGNLVRTYSFSNMTFLASGDWAAVKDNQIVLGKADSTTPLITLQALPQQKDRTLFAREHVVPSTRITRVAMSPDGKVIAASLALFGSGGAHWGGVAFWNAESGQFMRSINDILGEVSQFAFTPDGRYLVTAESYTMTARLWDVATGKQVLEFPHPDALSALSISPDGRTLLTSSSGYRGDTAAYLWDISTGKQLARFAGHSAPVTAVGFLKEGSIAVTASKDGWIRFWDANLAKLLVTVVHDRDGAWVAMTPEGRFDTNLASDQAQIGWVMPDDPDTLLPIEIFMKDYYEPRLLPRILNGEKFKPIRALTELNRVQPEVRIVSVTQDSKDAELAVVEVEVSGAKKNFGRDGKTLSIATAANDLRLFRDEQLVGYVDGQVVKQGDKPFRKTFTVHLPSSMHGQNITLSAYAFNDDRVKSATVRQTYRVPESVTAKKGNAYLISVGINQYNNHDLTLGYAANDARSMIDTLTAKLKATRGYQQIIPIPLLSNEQHHDAGKAQLQAVLGRMASKPATTDSTALLKDLPSADQLKPVTPDDLVILTFSGHGYADSSGNFYLLTQDAGTGALEDQLKRSVSSDELSQWLKDIDAGDMSLIIDACHSAASIEGQGYKPGPMGSRGLGQLAFDKGLRLLAASQADEFALEHASLEHGILSFALITNGIENFEADRAPKDKKIMLDEWLRYGVDRVPTLVDEIKAGKVQMASRDVSDVKIRGAKLAQGKKRVAQQPALFDFSKKRRVVEVAEQ